MNHEAPLLPLTEQRIREIVRDELMALLSPTSEPAPLDGLEVRESSFGEFVEAGGDRRIHSRHGTQR